MVIHVLLSHIIVSLSQRIWPRIVLLCLSFVINTVKWVHVLLDGLPRRALHLVDEDSDADSLNNEKKGKDTDGGEKESLLLLSPVLII